ncbi:MAG TPA: DUF1203 domain-containing protein [Vicinamibacterales bacterium]|nr:DUF1203 domain-containing protein [Vicinamibacterales bacterium]
MAFQVSALPEHEFAELFAFDERELGQRGARRYVADRKPGFPCRVSLEDASPGETVILTPFAHLSPDSPYRSTGPVFVRQGARRAAPAVDEVPELLRLRLLSVRAYDGESLMQDAEVVEGRDLEGVIRRFFADRRVSYLHVHFARPGCYACRIDRAEHGSVPRV